MYCKFKKKKTLADKILITLWAGTGFVIKSNTKFQVKHKGQQM